MKRKGLLAFGAALIAALTVVGSAAAVISTNINPANAPNGTHLQTGTIGCTVIGLTVSCSTYELGGVGNIDATLNLSATYSATVACRNSGGNFSDGQHRGSFTQSAPATALSSKNGRLSVPARSVSAPSQADFLAQQSCPNPNWTPELVSGITLQSFTYTLTFAGFGGAYITITGP